MLTNEFSVNMSQKKISCCYKCERREVGCRSDCKDWAKEQADRAIAKQMEAEYKQLNLIDSQRSISKRLYYQKGKTLRR